MATVKYFIEKNEELLRGIFDAHGQQSKSPYNSLMTTTLIKASLRGMLYDLKMHESRGAIKHDQLIEMQLEVAKIIVSLMHNYLGELNNHPYLDVYFFNVFYSNLTFEIEEYFEKFSSFEEKTSDLNDNYVEAFKSLTSLNLNEHLSSNPFFVDFKNKFRDHPKSLNSFLVGFTQTVLSFQLITEFAISEGYELPTSVADIQSQLVSVLDLFKLEIKMLLKDDIQIMFVRNFQNFVQGGSFESLYLSADESDLSDEIIMEKLSPETQEAIRMFEIFWDMDDSVYFKGTYLIAWAELIVKDTSPQRSKLIDVYGAILRGNKETVALMKATHFGPGDVFEDRRKESYKYVKNNV